MLKQNIFTPYYINQNRLFDLYSILNNGYCEYEEIPFTHSPVTKTNDKKNLGFKFIKISNDLKSSYKNEKMNEPTMKKIQTVTSILNTVLTKMHEEEHMIKEIEKSSVGDFVEIDINFKLNSIEHVLQQLNKYLQMLSFIETLSFGTGIKRYRRDEEHIYVASINDDVKKFANYFDTFEVVYENDEYAIVSNLNKSSLYLSQIDDVVDTDIKCFCQIKNIHTEEVELLRNTIFSQIKNTAEKTKLLDEIYQLGSKKSIDLGYRVYTKIKNKKVYEIEIMSLSAGCRAGCRLSSPL